jgi:putative oxidoreductase
MRFLGMPTHRIAGVAPLVVRVIVGVIMIDHGLTKLVNGIPQFGTVTLVPLGVPYPDAMAYVVTITEIVGGVLLVVGMLSRLAALALLIEMATTLTLVKSHVGLIAPATRGAGAELDLALAAGFLTVFLAGPGVLSLDSLLKIERWARRDSPATAA